MCLPTPKAPVLPAPVTPPPPEAEKPLEPLASPESQPAQVNNTAAARATSRGRRALRIDLQPAGRGGTGLAIPT